MFSPITAADNIKDEFIGYISTLFHISDKDYAAQFAAALREEGAIAKGPYLDVSDSYKTGKSLAQMIEGARRLHSSTVWREIFPMVKKRSRSTVGCISIRKEPLERQTKVRT